MIYTHVLNRGGRGVVLRRTGCDGGGAGKWRCTDLGSRVIVAIRIDAQDPRNLAGPPYSIAECMFDEYDIDGCSLDPSEFT